MMNEHTQALPKTDSAPRGARRGRRVLANLSLVIISLLVALFVGEVAIRLLSRFAPQWVPELASFESMQFHLKELVQPSENPRLYYELIPGHSSFEVNAAGYRGPLCRPEKPPGVLRIVGIGDSNMFAWELPESAGYLRQLEVLWNAKSRERRAESRGWHAESGKPKGDVPSSQHGDQPRPLQVINLAVPGYNTAEYLEVLRSRALEWDPDLIIIGYDHNDVEPIASPHQHSYVMPDDYGNNALGSQLIRWAWRKARVLSWSWKLADPGGNESVPPTLPFTPAYLSGGPLWERHLERFREMNELLKNRDPAIGVLVFIHDAWITADPDLRSRHYQEIHRPLLEFFRGLGWYVVDGYALFQDYMAQTGGPDLRNLWINARLRDGHPNPLAHRLIAERLLEEIRRNRLLPRIESKPRADRTIAPANSESGRR